MGTEPLRFHDPGLTLEHYLDVVLVACPSCAARVPITPPPGGDPKPFGDRRLACAGCGHVRTWPPPGVQRRSYVTGRPTDPWFDLPLWYRTDVGRHVLWAYNDAHVDLLRSFVAAAHRRPDADVGHRHGSVANNLPAWIGAASNRAAILRAVDRWLRSDP